MPRVSRLSNERGFTLLEVLGSLAVLTILVAAIIQLFGYLRLTDSAGDIEREALRHAEKVSNDIRVEIQALRKAGIGNIRLGDLGYSSIPAPRGMTVTVEEKKVSRTTPIISSTAITNGVSFASMVYYNDDPHVIYVRVTWGSST